MGIKNKIANPSVKISESIEDKLYREERNYRADRL